MDEAAVVAVEQKVAGGGACDRGVHLKHLLLRQARPRIEHLGRHATATQNLRLDDPWNNVLNRDQVSRVRGATCITRF